MTLSMQSCNGFIQSLIQVLRNLAIETRTQPLQKVRNLVDFKGNEASTLSFWNKKETLDTIKKSKISKVITSHFSEESVLIIRPMSGWTLRTVFLHQVTSRFAKITAGSWNTWRWRHVITDDVTWSRDPTFLKSSTVKGKLSVSLLNSPWNRSLTDDW